MENKIDDRTYFLRTNEDLYKAALWEFSHKSFEEASLNDIIKKAGFNKGSFYYRYQDKMDLFMALVDDLDVTMRSLAGRDIFLSEQAICLEDVINMLFETLYKVYEDGHDYIGLLKRIKENREIGGVSFIDEMIAGFKKTLAKYPDTREFAEMLAKELEIHLYQVSSFIPQNSSIDDFNMAAGSVNTLLTAECGPLAGKLILERKKIQDKHDARKTITSIGSIKRNSVIGVIDESRLKLDEYAFTLMNTKKNSWPLRIRREVRAKTAFIDTKESIGDIRKKKVKDIIKDALKQNETQHFDKEMEKVAEIFLLSDSLETKATLLKADEIMFLKLCLAIIGNPTLIIVMWPDLIFDEDKKQRFLAVLLKYRPIKCTIVLMSTTLNEILDVSDSILLLKAFNDPVLMERDEIIQNHRVTSVSLQYMKDGQMESETFALDAKGRPKLADLAAKYDILSISTTKTYDRVVTGWEKGVDCV